jgi:hypothetical protein
MKEIPLTQEKVAMGDDEDFEELSQRNATMATNKAKNLCPLG